MKFPRRQKIGVDELVLGQPADKIVDIDSLSEQNLPETSPSEDLIKTFMDNIPFMVLYFEQFCSLLQHRSKYEPLNQHC